ncbi:DNA/RNA-binding domain E.t1.c1-type [Penicillium malachiteum]|uniref:DNA/RNA-binding domain E.t1.c1-type n=1 Tax=Penicillium malachiteum TaxID=1324776 RepID=A0AAD6HCR7_9EURO|nr:DNA/RNA-binding domain E.t1.c1-type [Penicillium malachiteum]
MGENSSRLRTKTRSNYGAPSSTLVDPRTWKGHSQPPRYIGRVRSEEEFPRSSMANRLHPSASPPLSNGRPNSGVFAGESTLETHSNNGNRRAKSSRTSTTRPERFRHRGSPKISRNRLSTASSNPQVRNYHQSMPVGGMINQRPLDAGLAGLAREQDQRHDWDIARPDSKRFHSNPTAPTAAPGNEEPTNEAEGENSHMQSNHDVSMQEAPAEINNSNHPSDLRSMMLSSSPVPEIVENRGMFKQLETNIITEEQLISEVRVIYKGLTLVEQKCKDIDEEQSKSQNELTAPQWAALISLHRTLLYEHHDFLLASQHPSASPLLTRLADQYYMPARMWRHGIHSFLEVMRQQLPKSMDFLLSYIYVSYSMISLLLESVGAFKETWMECLGDLARYRMAIEESDMGERETWAGISRYWYNQDALIIPEQGRIQHHLAVLARPDGLRQLFHYTKALVSVISFENAQESIALLFKPTNNKGKEGMQRTQNPMIATFIAAHGILFAGGSKERFPILAKRFLSFLRKELPRLNRNPQEGVYLRFPLQGAYLAVHTIAFFLEQNGTPAMDWSAHTSLAFIWCLALSPPAMQRLETIIPWLPVINYLNRLFRPETDFSHIENESFPIRLDEDRKQLTEDFFIRGQVWSQQYHPPGFFDNASSEDSRPVVEEESTIKQRQNRCLWLGVRIAMIGRWITYTRNGGFAPTKFAYDFSGVAATCGGLNRSVPTTIDHEMGGA